MSQFLTINVELISCNFLYPIRIQCKGSTLISWVELLNWNWNGVRYVTERCIAIHWLFLHCIGYVQCAEMYCNCSTVMQWLQCTVMQWRRCISLLQWRMQSRIRFISSSPPLAARPICSINTAMQHIVESCCCGKTLVAQGVKHLTQSSGGLEKGRQWHGPKVERGGLPSKVEGGGMPSGHQIDARRRQAIRCLMELPQVQP